MKKFLFLGACVASLAIASSSAFAAVSYGQDDTLTITSPAADSTGAVTSISVDASNFGTTGQMTVLVLNGTDSTNITADNILYIDQEAAGTNIFQDMGLKLPEGADKLADGSYKIMVGNDQGAAIRTAVLTISSTTTPKKTVAYGDVNADGDVTSLDSSLVLQKAVKLIDGFKDQSNVAIPDGAGDVNGDGDVTSLDSSLVLQKAVKLIDGFKDQENKELVNFEY